MQNWEIKKLSDICSIQTGKHDANHATETGKYRFYTCAAQYLWCDTVRFSGECLILPGNGVNVGEVYYYNGDFDAYQRTYVISEISKDVYARFLYYNMLLNWKKNGTAKQYGSATNFIKIGNFLEYEIPLPPLEEQKRIVKILDEKFAQLETVKANAKANLQNAKDLFQSQLTKVFSNTTWEKKVLLKDIAKDFSRGKSKHRPRNDKCLFGGNYPFIQTGDIRNTEKYITEYVDTYNETGLAQSKLWPEGTLCITIAANIAETAILTFPCCFPDSVIGFVPNEDITTADYVFYLLQFFKAELQVLGKGAAQDNINLGTFEKMEFPLPPLSEQKRIVEQLDSLSEKTKALQDIYKKILLDCDELKQALLQKAFDAGL